jgi:hypothetical protein
MTTIADRSLHDVDDVTVIAVDWSGAGAADERRCPGIWITAVRNGEVVQRRGGWSRREAIEFVAHHDAPVIAGFDFAFGPPRWFALAHGCLGVDSVWALAGRDGERWLAPTPPFWKENCPVPPELRFRECEKRLRQEGWQPKSVFQLVGAGMVGPGSVRGMRLLPRLREAGVAIWPFAAASDRIAVEIYPAVLKPRATRRFAPYSSDDDRDATESAEVMWAHRKDFEKLARATDSRTLVEGAIWAPP